MKGLGLLEHLRSGRKVRSIVKHREVFSAMRINMFLSVWRGRREETRDVGRQRTLGRSF